MAFKSLVAAGLMALSMAFVPTAAEAKTKVVIGIGTGWPGDCWGSYRCDYRWRHRPHYYVNPGVVYYGRPHHYYYDEPDYYRPHRPRVASCAIARNVVRDHGFRKVVARDCSGRIYSFGGRKNGKSYIIRVKASNARIVDIDRR